MRNEIEKFHHTVNVLVKAYINNTLEHQNCYACAVGNIIADACGYSYKPAKAKYQTIKWSHVPGVYYSGVDQPNHWYDFIRYQDIDDKDRIIREINSTGYSVDELNSIEWAFENAPGEFDPDADWMFNGLMAVVDLLADIHGIDLKAKEEAKALFVKAPIL